MPDANAQTALTDTTGTMPAEDVKSYLALYHSNPAAFSPAAESALKDWAASQGVEFTKPAPTEATAIMRPGTATPRSSRHPCWRAAGSS